VKATGDGVLLEFPSVVDAIELPRHPRQSPLREANAFAQEDGGLAYWSCLAFSSGKGPKSSSWKSALSALYPAARRLISKPRAMTSPSAEHTFHLHAPRRRLCKIASKI
jgi:hypothetical protein